MIVRVLHTVHAVSLPFLLRRGGNARLCIICHGNDNLAAIRAPKDKIVCQTCIVKIKQTCIAYAEVRIFCLLTSL